MFRSLASLRPALSLLLAAIFSLPAQAAAPDWCAQIGKRLGSVPTEQCRKLGLEAAPEKTRNGHALMRRDYPAAAQKIAALGKGERPPRILIIGGIHGDELAAASLVFRWMRWIDEGDARQYHWRVIPVANPDGLLATPPQRTNANGVDLNRNFPTPDWTEDAHAYWQSKTRKDPRRFPGKQANSEIETRWLNAQIEDFKPDVIVATHAPYGLLDYDGPARQPRRFGHLNLNRLGVYPGSLGNYGGVHKKLPVITIELPNANSLPPLKEQREIWDDMQTWLRRNIGPRQVS